MAPSGGLWPPGHHLLKQYTPPFKSPVVIQQHADDGFRVDTTPSTRLPGRRRGGANRGSAGSGQAILS